MKIVIAPQAFKGCASAQTIAGTIAAGIHRAFPETQLVLAPVADGGDDTLDLLLTAKSGERHYSQVLDALGKIKIAHWGVLTNAFPKTAIIESARICGLAHLERSGRNPLRTTTFGIGELINEALEKGYQRIFIGLGGTATNDAGMGIAQALGVKFLDEKSQELPKGGGSLIHLKSIDTSDLNPAIKNAEIIVGCDVTNPFTGPNGATHLFGPQKGANKEMIALLEKGFSNFASIVKKQFQKDITSLPYLGAAGGSPASLLLFCNATLVSGAKWILKEMNFDKIIQGADLVITGEGCLDFQTSFQKAPLVVIEAAQKQNIPVMVIAGKIGHGVEFLKESGVHLVSVNQNSDEIPSNALQLLAQASEKAIVNFFKN